MMTSVDVNWIKDNKTTIKLIRNIYNTPHTHTLILWTRSISCLLSFQKLWFLEQTEVEIDSGHFQTTEFHHCFLLRTFFLVLYDCTPHRKSQINHLYS